MMLSRQSTKPLPQLFREYHDTSVEFQEAVSKWEQGLSDEISYIDGFELKVYASGTAPGGPNIGKPVFQYKKEPFKTFGEGGLMIAESDNCVSFIPGGFRDAPTINTMNPVREEIGGESALMSLVHIITIPKKTRIYNAATLKKEHIPLLEEMRKLGNKAVDILLNGPKEMIGSLQWVYRQSGDIVMNDGSKKSQVVTISDLSLSCQKNYNKQLNKYKILDSFHVYPTTSVGWLHLHTYVGDLLTTAHDTLESTAKAKGYKKNTMYDEVIQALQ